MAAVQLVSGDVAAMQLQVVDINARFKILSILSLLMRCNCLKYYEQTLVDPTTRLQQHVSMMVLTINFFLRLCPLCNHSYS